MNSVIKDSRKNYTQEKNLAEEMTIDIQQQRPEAGWPTENVQDSVDHDGVRKDIRGQGPAENRINMDNGGPLEVSKRGSTEYMGSIYNTQIQQNQASPTNSEAFQHKVLLKPQYKKNGKLEEAEIPVEETMQDILASSRKPKKMFSSDFSESAVDHSEIQLVDNINKFGQSEQPRKKSFRSQSNKKDSNSGIFESLKKSRAFKSMRSKLGYVDYDEIHPKECDNLMARNKQIEQMRPPRYQFMYHLKSLRKIEDLVGVKDHKVQISKEDMDVYGNPVIDDNFDQETEWMNTQMIPHVVKGRLFSIIFSYQKSNFKSTFKGEDQLPTKAFEARTLLRIIKHDIRKDGNKKPQVILSRYLMEKSLNWKTMKNAVPGIINNNKLYYSVIESTSNGTVQCFKIMEFDFGTLNESLIVERQESIPKVLDDLELMPVMGMLSVYFHIDKKTLKFDEHYVMSHQYFLDNTFCQYHFRTPKPDSDGLYTCKMETYRLSEFTKALNEEIYTKTYNKDTHETMSKEFVQFGKLYLSTYCRNTLNASYQDIAFEDGVLNLSKVQDASLIDDETNERMTHYFQEKFSIHSLVVNPESNKKELHHYHISEKEEIELFTKLAEEWDFQLGDLNDCELESMNIIFDTTSQQIHAHAGSMEFFESKTIPMDVNFTKIKKMEDQWDKNKNVQFQPHQRPKQSIDNGTVKMEIKASQTEGIFLQISTLADEVVLQEMLQFKFDNETYKMTSITWSSEIKPFLNGKLQQKFLVARVNPGRQIVQVAEYRIIWDQNIFTEDKKQRIFDENHISNFQFLRFLKNCSDYITIQYITLNVIVLRDPLPQAKCFLFSKVAKRDEPEIELKKGEIKGGEWWSSTGEKRLSIKFGEILGENHNLRSDIAETQYRIYENQNNEKLALHIQTTLTQAFRDMRKSPWQRASHVIDSIYKTQALFSSKFNESGVFGLSGHRWVTLLRKMTDIVSLSQNDRQSLIDAQVRTVINMIPVKFDELILDEENIDIFNPIEQLNCQCLCDFYLSMSDHVKRKLEQQKSTAGTGVLRDSLIEEFCKTQPDKRLFNDLIEEGFIQEQNELIGGLFGANCLNRCFMGKQQITTAQLLLDHIFTGDITFTERSILMQAMPFILESKLEPFPFDKFSEFFKQRPNDGLCFFQHLHEKELDMYSDRHHQLTMSNQNNLSAASSLKLKAHLTINDVLRNQKDVDQHHKTIPVQHALVDYHTMNMFFKIRQFRAKKPIANTRVYTLSEHLLMISEKFSQDIKEHPVLMKISDCLFDRTRFYYNTLLFIQLAGFFVPLMVQIASSNENFEGASSLNNMGQTQTAAVTPNDTKAGAAPAAPGQKRFLIGDTATKPPTIADDVKREESKLQSMEQILVFDNESLVLRCNYLCIATCIFFQIQELMQWQHLGFKRYWYSLSNVVNHVTWILYYYYFAVRVAQPGQQVLPFPEEPSSMPLVHQAHLSIIQYLLILGSMFFTLMIIRVQHAVGQQVALVTAVAKGVIAFFFFLLSWVLVFSFLHRVIGNRVDTDGKLYPNLSITVKYFLYAWSVSTAGSKPPKMGQWLEMNSEGDKEQRFAYLMMGFNWFNLVFNQIFVKTILLAFLISLIKGIFDKQNKIATENNYAQRAEMNQHCSIIMSNFGLLYETDLIVISADYYVNQKPKNNEIAKLGQEMKCMKTQITEQEDQMQDMCSSVNEMRKEMDDIRQMMKQMLRQNQSSKQGK